MSRFKLFGILQAMALAVMGDTKKHPYDKNKEVSEINRRGGGMLFGGSPYGPARQLNQRQKRKRWAQNR
jgi:hypothetical protein